VATLEELRHGPPVGAADDRDTDDRNTDDQTVTERT